MLSARLNVIGSSVPSERDAWLLDALVLTASRCLLLLRGRRDTRPPTCRRWRRRRRLRAHLAASIPPHRHRGRQPGRAEGARCAAKRPRGVFSRQLILGDNLDTEHIAASYHSGVLILQIPVAEQAKPRKISISSQSEDRQAINA